MDADRAAQLVGEGRGRGRRQPGRGRDLPRRRVRGWPCCTRPTSTTRASTSSTARGGSVRLPGAFTRPDDPVVVSRPTASTLLGGHLFVTYVGRAPVDGNDAPTGGYVDEFDLAGQARRARRACGAERAVGARARARVIRPVRRRPSRRELRRPARSTASASAAAAGRSTACSTEATGKPLVVNGVWGIAFGNGGMAGPREHALRCGRAAPLARRERARGARADRGDLAGMNAAASVPLHRRVEREARTARSRRARTNASASAAPRLAVHAGVLPLDRERPGVADLVQRAEELVEVDVAVAGRDEVPAAARSPNWRCEARIERRPSSRRLESFTCTW